MGRYAAARIHALPEPLGQVVGSFSCTVTPPRRIGPDPHRAYALADEAGLLLTYERAVREAETAAGLRAPPNADPVRRHRTDPFLSAPARTARQPRFSPPTP